MRLFRFDAGVGISLAAYASQNVVLSRIALLSGTVQVGCMHLQTGGNIGYHQARVRQLLMVVRGEGWVRAESPERTPVSEGMAAFWEDGEWHESGTDNGMVAIVIEAETLDPGRFMAEV